MRILLAEDDQQISLILERLLTSRGYEVLKAAHVEDVAALIEAEETAPMAIVEFGLPGGGGADVCRRLRQASNGYTFILMLTGLADEATLRAAIDAGANDLVEKPLDLLELASRVGEGRRRVEALAGLGDIVGNEPIMALWIQRDAIELPRAARGGPAGAARRLVWQ
jgi:DNA-binding response OmpR family regulator